MGGLPSAFRDRGRAKAMLLHTDTHLQRESLVSGLVMLVFPAGDRADEGLEGGTDAPTARRVDAARVSEARRMSVQALLVPQLKVERIPVPPK
jgi:hypothetical protein